MPYDRDHRAGHFSALAAATIFAAAIWTCAAGALGADGRVARLAWTVPAKGAQLMARRDRVESPVPHEPVAAPRTEYHVPGIDMRLFDAQRFVAVCSGSMTREPVEADATPLLARAPADFHDAPAAIDAPLPLAGQSAAWCGPLTTVTPRRRASAPTGTMFLMSVEQFAAQPPEASSREHRPGASAGFVLSRPPGDYSLDWFGVAISAPIH